jgi:hypothetical protein
VAEDRRVELNHAPSVEMGAVEREGGMDRPARGIQDIMATGTLPLPALKSVKVLDQLRGRIRLLNYSRPTEEA